MSRKLIRECLIRIKFFPVIIALALIVWSYYAFIFCYFLGDFKGSSYQVSVFLIYHSTYVLLFWCFIKTMKSQVCRPPNQFYLTMARDQLIKECLYKEDKNRILTNSILSLPVMMRCFDGGVRYCGKCRCLKPDRAHHCSLCQTCVLKMDHHCPWVNNCIGFANYKFFVLFLFYAFNYCIILWFLLTPDVTEFIGTHSNDYHRPIPPSKHVIVLWMCSTLFSFGLGMLLLLHCCLLISNQTTIEIFQTPVFVCGPLKRAYNLGPRTNFVQVFGHVKKFWLLPIHTSNGDGVNYPIREKYKSMLERYLLALRQGSAEEGLSI